MDNSLTPIKLAGINQSITFFIITPKIVPGQRLILVQTPESNALYTLDKFHTPFQIAGTRDLLLDADKYQDLTQNYQATLYHTQRILNAVFENLSMNDMLNNTYLSDIEWEIKEQALLHNMNFKDVCNLCIFKFNNISDKRLRDLILMVINRIKYKKTKADIFYVNWGDYNIRNQIEIPAID